MVWSTICQRNSKKNFMKEYAALDDITSIKIHKVRRILMQPVIAIHLDLV